MRELGTQAVSLGTAIASGMNAALEQSVTSLPGVKVFDAFDVLGDVVNDKQPFGLLNVSDACAQFVDCVPSSYLFWDGAHPTSAGHQFLAAAMLQTVAVPEPSTAILFLVALALVLTVSRRTRLTPSQIPEFRPEQPANA